MKFIKTLILTTLPVFPITASAESFDPVTYTDWGSVLGLTQNVVLKINDKVTDGCWTNSDSIRSNAFLKFEQNGIFVPSYDPAFINHETPIALLSTLGFRTNSGLCAVTARFSVTFRSSEVLGGYQGKERFGFETVVETFSV